YLTFQNRNSLRTELSWTHYRMIMKVENENAREWYLEEATKGIWSTRQNVSDMSEKMKDSEEKRVPHLEHLLHLISFNLKDAEKENSEDSIKAWRDWNEKYKGELETARYVCDVANRIVEQIESLKIVKVFFIIAYASLFILLALSSVVSNYLQFASHPAFSLLSLALAVSATLAKSKLTSIIYNRLVNSAFGYFKKQKIETELKENDENEK
ncbi:MAG: DUF1016 N-terminal domain-containing protein, partial [Defluviitaleaceae bacterium]|nr:DUF1016 N-terminal domain-containing protein [Defluviitaleaceae bacterium]